MLVLTSALLATGLLLPAAVAGASTTDVTGTVATHSLEAQQTLTGADGAPLNGTGVTIAVIDTGVDPTHPSFQLLGGATKVVRSLSSTWILQNHAAPCGPGVPASTCPPIKVINNSWGSSDSTMISLQDQLAASGVVTVWANGNQGGNGSTDNSNPAGEDPAPGILSVANYDDLGTGTTDGDISPTSSRGLASNPATWPDISAPGVNIVSSCRPAHAICALLGTKSYNGPGPNDTGTFNTMSGTSWSAAEISGIVAQLFQADPAATAGDIEAALKSTAHKYASGAPYQQEGPYTSSFDKGTGLADAYAAALQLGARPSS